MTTANTILAPKTGTQVGNAVIPAEGPMAVPYNMNFALSLSYSINVRDLLQTGPGYPGLSRIQSLWIDNSQNNAELMVSITQTNQFIYAPPNSQGYYSVLSPNAGQINFSTGAGPLVYVTVLNFPVSGDQWYPNGISSSGNTYTGGYLNTLDATLAAIKGTTTSANAIPVDVVNSTGGGSIQPSVQCFINDNVGFSAGLTSMGTQYPCGTSNYYVLTDLQIILPYDTFYASGGLFWLQIRTSNGGNNILYYTEFSIPTTARSSGQDTIIVSRNFPNGMSTQNAGAIYAQINGPGNLTGSGVKVIMRGYQSATNLVPNGSIPS